MEAKSPGATLRGYNTDRDPPLRLAWLKQVDNPVKSQTSEYSRSGSYRRLAAQELGHSAVRVFRFNDLAVCLEAADTQILLTHSVAVDAYGDGNTQCDDVGQQVGRIQA